VGASTGGALAGALGAAAGFGLGAIFFRISDRRFARRRSLLVRPFPKAWRTFLETRYDHYDRLPADLRRRFENDLQIFLGEKRITGVEVEVTDEMRLLVGASAVTLSLGWPSYEWEQLTEVLLYPDGFDRDYNFGNRERVGEADRWGSIILSVPSLRESFEDPDDAYHVGIHEFAHLLDVDRRNFDGIPPGLDEIRRVEWVELAAREMDRLRRGQSVLDPYGAQDPVEFLAVAVEAFFETPLSLRRSNAAMYALLCAYFVQDPAAWDDARGLVEP
jgi:Mlc titration factor MtfA (ptsG expression regulator)